MTPIRIEISGDPKTEIEIYRKIQQILEPYLMQQNPIAHIFLSSEDRTVQLIRKLGRSKLIMLNCIGDKKLTVEEISKKYGRTEVTVYGYTRQLRDSGYLNENRECRDGKWLYVYSLTEKGKKVTSTV